MVEEQVDEVFLGAEGETVLSADETKTVAKLENEVAQPFDEPVFQLTLANDATDAKELQIIPALERFLRLFGQMLRQDGGKIVRFVLLQRTLVGLRLDLVEEDVAAPTEASCGAEVVKAGGGGFCFL